MNRILIGAIALSLIGGSAAMAQPYRGDTQGGRDSVQQYGNDRGDPGRRDRGDDRRGDHRRGHRVCVWRDHHRVCSDRRY